MIEKNITISLLLPIKEPEDWCLYVANGISNEVSRVTKLLDKEYAIQNLITPAIRQAFEDGYINKDEFDILVVAMEKDIFRGARYQAYFWHVSF